MKLVCAKCSGTVFTIEVDGEKYSLVCASNYRCGETAPFKVEPVPQEDPNQFKYPGIVWFPTA